MCSFSLTPVPFSNPLHVKKRAPEPYLQTEQNLTEQTLVGRPILSGCDGPTERPSSFVDKLLQPVAQIQQSYLKDTTHFIRFIESTRVPRNAFLVSMEVTSLYTNIPHEEGITIVCNAYENFHAQEPPLATKFLTEMLSLVLKESSFQFKGKNTRYLLPWALK